MKLHHVIFMCVFAYGKSNAKFCDISGDDPTTQCYAKEIIFTIAHSPHQMAVDTNSNTLYFSFDSGQGDYIPALFNLDTKQLTVLKGVKDAFAMFYDNTTKLMYFGGTYGIYKYDIVSKELKRLHVKNLDIWWLNVKKYVYFIKFPSLYTYSYVNGSIKTLSALTENAIHQMVIDRDDNLIFINNTRLYGVKPEGKEAILINDRPRFLNMANDLDGNVHVCGEEGIFTISKIRLKVKKLANVYGALGLTFDKFNNIIYSDSHDIVRLLLHTSK